jgi:hypothetical protein
VGCLARLDCCTVQLRALPCVCAWPKRKTAVARRSRAGAPQHGGAAAGCGGAAAGAGAGEEDHRQARVLAGAGPAAGCQGHVPGGRRQCPHRLRGHLRGAPGHARAGDSLRPQDAEIYTLCCGTTTRLQAVAATHTKWAPPCWGHSAQSVRTHILMHRAPDCLSPQGVWTH